MTQRKALILSIAPFLLVGIAILAIPVIWESQQEKFRTRIIESPFTPLGVKPHRVDMTHYMRLIWADGEIARRNTDRDKFLTGTEMEPFDTCTVGPLRLLFERKERDWGRSGEDGVLVAEAPQIAPRLKNRDPSAPFAPVRCRLYEKGRHPDKILEAKQIESGSELTFVGHVFKVRNWELEIDGKRFSLDSRPTTIVLDISGRVLSTHTH
jgi:hypothetical protein